MGKMEHHGSEEPKGSGGGAKSARPSVLRWQCRREEGSTMWNAMMRCRWWGRRRRGVVDGTRNDAGKCFGRRRDKCDSGEEEREGEGKLGEGKEDSEGHCENPKN